MARLPRFCQPQATPLEIGRAIALDDRARHHAERVLRLRAGAVVEVFDGRGEAVRGPIGFGQGRAWVEATAPGGPGAEPGASLTLIQALISSERLDWVIEKAVEAGYRRIIVCPTERSQFRLAEDRRARRAERWHELVMAACEQCGRDLLPTVTAAPTLERALSAVTAGTRWLLHPGAPAGGPPARGVDLALAVGPEGGFSDREVALAQELGWRCRSLGRSVLRSESAALLAAGAALAWLGEYG